MALPPAQKDISEHPVPGSVTDPVNKRQKDADVDRKLRFYGVIQAFREGRLPTNAQIDRALRYVEEHSPMDLNSLSREGQSLVRDTREVVEIARRIVMEKNKDELFQNFVWHTREIDVSRTKVGPDASGVDAEQARAARQRAVQHVRTLLKLVLTNGETRKLMADFANIGRDLLAKGAAKAAERIGPHPTKLEAVDEPAPPDQFHQDDKIDSILRGERLPTDKAEEIAASTRQHATETVEQAKGGIIDGREKIEEGQMSPRDVAEEKKETTKLGMKERLNGIRDNVLGRVPADTKDKVGEHFERGRKFLAEEYFPEERRERFIYRAKKVIVECQRHDDYQAAVKWLLDFLEDYIGTGHENVKTAVSEKSEALREDPSLNQALSELRTLLERFANGKSFDEIKERIDVLKRDAREDEQLRNWFKDVNTFIRKCLLEPGYILQESCNEEGRKLRDSGRVFYDEKYKSHFDAMFDAVGSFFKAMADDPLNKQFGESISRLTKDLLFDSEGDLKFKFHLWNDIRKVILPAVIERVGYIPIPRVEYTDESLDLVIENLALSGRNLFPNIVTLDAHNFVKFSPYSAIEDEHYHQLVLHLGQIQADIRDVAIYFNKKTGIKIRDSGIADVVLGGEGLSATIHVASTVKDPTSVFKVVSVNVKIGSLKFSIRDSKHDVLYNTLRPLATGLVKRQIQKVLSDAIRTGLEYVDGQLVSVRDRMREVKEDSEESRTQILKELFHRHEAASMKSSVGRSFKVVSKRESSLLSEEGHPAGLINREEEIEEKVHKGVDWRSEAFTIV